MSLLVKVCGLTTEAGITAVIDAGADAVGFVFHHASPRNLDPERAAQLARAVPDGVRRIAVTLRPSQALVDRILRVFMPDVWQSDLADFETIRIPDAIRRWPVLRSGGTLPSKLPPTLLFDAAMSGAGMRADWAMAAGLARRSALILGGGLNARTVGGAIEAVKPIGVDVSSGVERATGVKDAALIRDFVAAARAAKRRVDA